MSVRLRRQERFAVLGTSAKFIDAVRKAGLEPAQTHDLSSLGC
jgi:acetoacetyl-CoA synthetase